MSKKIVLILTMLTCIVSFSRTDPRPDPNQNEDPSNSQEKTIKLKYKNIFKPDGEMFEIEYDEIYDGEIQDKNENKNKTGYILEEEPGGPEDGIKLVSIIPKKFKLSQKFLDKINGTPNAIAIANIPQVSFNKRFSIGAGVGYYGKKAAFALGLSGQDNNHKFIYKISTSVDSKRGFGVGAGFNYSFGEINHVPNDEVFDLKKEVKDLKAKNKELEKRLELIEKRLNLK